MIAPFNPTTCACKEDQANCKRQPGHLLPGQLAEIMAHLGETDAAKYFCDSPGMVVRRADDQIAQRIRTIAPQFKHGRCVFFQTDGHCAIHAVAPFGCRFFDVHMGEAEGQRRALYGAHRIIDSIDEYASERASLPLATHYKPRSG